MLGIKRGNKKRKLSTPESSGERWCNVCEHSFPSQLKFANHLRRKDEFGRLCRPPPQKSDSINAAKDFTQAMDGLNRKQNRRIGIIRKGTR